MPRDEMWEGFIKANSDLSVEKLEIIKGFSDMMYDLGEIAGLEKGQAHMASVMTVNQLF